MTGLFATVLVVNVMLTEAHASKATGGDYQLTKDVVQSGHNTLQSNDGHRLQGTSGQMAVGQSSGGGYTLTSGFHAPKRTQGEAIFSNGFE